MIRLARILCPLDLVPDSAAALRYAVALAQAYHAKLVVCHFPGAVLPMEATEILAKLAEMIAPYLLNANPELQVEVVIVHGNDAADAITGAAAEQQIDLVVMQSRRRPLAAALLGSVAEAVCRAAPCAVFVTHPQEEAREKDAFFAPRSVLVAHDFSACSRVAFAWGLALAQLYQAELHLLHVVAPDTYLDLDYESGLGTIGQGVLADLERELMKELPAGHESRCVVKREIRMGKPAAEILAYANQQQVDLLCIGAHDDSKPRGLFGSNADVMLRQALCPILVAQ